MRTQSVSTRYAVISLASIGLLGGCPFFEPVLSPPPPPPAQTESVTGITAGQTFEEEGFATIEVLDAPCAAFFCPQILRINDSGQALADWFTDPDSVAVLYEGSDVRSIAMFTPTAISDAGQVVGHVDFGSINSRAFLWSDGTTTRLPLLPNGNAAWPFDINAAGQIVGWAENSDYPRLSLFRLPSSPYQSPVIWELVDGQWRVTALLDCLGEATAINDSGQVVGWCGSGPFQWDSGVVTELSTLGGLITDPRDINDAGQIVGFSETSALVEFPVENPGPRRIRRAVLWQGGDIIDLGTLGGQTSEAHAINNLGQIVGIAATENFDVFDERSASEHKYPFIWQDGVMTDLNDFLPPLSNWFFVEANDINEAGQILTWATYRLEDGTSEGFYVLVTLPVRD